MTWHKTCIFRWASFLYTWRRQFLQATCDFVICSNWQEAEVRKAWQKLTMPGQLKRILGHSEFAAKTPKETEKYLSCRWFSYWRTCFSTATAHSIFFLAGRKCEWWIACRRSLHQFSCMFVLGLDTQQLKATASCSSPIYPFPKRWLQENQYVQGSKLPLFLYNRGWSSTQ